jgi:xylulokinase
MSCLLGIDLGTSSVKAVVINLRGTVKGIGAAEYPILTPRVSYAEQEPAEWWRATVAAVRQSASAAGRPEILGVGFSGQMHGFVLVDKDGSPVRPAIIWADQRSASLLPAIKETVGLDLLAKKCGTAPAAGFLISSLYWLQKNELASVQRSWRFLLPKDFIRFKLSGELNTDESDAAATGVFDVSQRVWAEDVIEKLHFPRSIFPETRVSTDIVGVLGKDAAVQLDLAPGIPVATGCADQPAQAVGNGLIDPPLGSVTIGTGGQVFVPLAHPVFDSQLRIHTFCHAPKARWYFLGAMLSAGMALRWLRGLLGLERASYAELDRLATEVEPGCEGLAFLPYLVGERSPIMDPQAKAGFVGLTLRHTPGHLVRALLEGVAFALRQIIETMAECGAELSTLAASGNGLASPLWRQMLADVLNRPLVRGVDEYASERAGVGAAMIAGIGAGVFRGYEEARRLAPAFDAVTTPDPDRVGLYELHYQRFADLYPKLKDWF